MTPLERRRKLEAEQAEFPDEVLVSPSGLASLHASPHVRLPCRSWTLQWMNLLSSDSQNIAV